MCVIKVHLFDFEQNKKLKYVNAKFKFMVTLKFTFFNTLEETKLGRIYHKTK